MITKISSTVHTAGINSFSMYEHFTQPFDGIPKQNTVTRFLVMSQGNDDDDNDNDNDDSYPGHEVVGLVPRLLVQLVTLETLGALGDGGPVHLNLATASVMEDLTLLHY